MLCTQPILGSCLASHKLSFHLLETYVQVNMLLRHSLALPLFHKTSSFDDTIMFKETETYASGQFAMIF